ITGNGDFDSKSQWGESFLKLKYIPPSGTEPASLTVVDHWTPWTDLARAGQAPKSAMKLAGMNAPSEAMKTPMGGMSDAMKTAKLVPMVSDQGIPTLLVFPQMAAGAWSD